MSPLAWQILEGKGTIPLSLFEAIDRVDAGPIYLSDQVEFDGTELLPDMQSALGRKMVDMCVRFAANRETLRAGARPQSGTPSYYPWRTPADSQLDPHHTIAEQFDLLRIVDNRRYPAYFDFRGRRYVLSITHAKDTK
jgi:methionyl-tRNA formyltransferase